ncbi:MAG: hydroxymethylglutaryl-CoA reductase, degradative [Anaerolineae bacterium]
MARSTLLNAVAERSSRLSGFYRLDHQQRRDLVAEWAHLNEADMAALATSLEPTEADVLVENVVGVHTLPVGIATNLRVNGRDVLVPMAVEEPSVIAAASHGALMARRGGGFRATADEPVMIGQIQVAGLPADGLEAAAEAVRAATPLIMDIAQRQSPTLARLGGGAKGLEVRTLPETPAGAMLVVHILYDTRDAMGANAVNTACEAVAPLVEEVTGGTVILRILTNLAARRLVTTECTVPVECLSRPGMDGAEVARRIVAANALAVVDAYRAATHNKGVMNGIDAVVVATGNDWRGVEAGAHAYAARDGAYRSLTNWRQEEGRLVGTLEIPLALGTVGGGTRAYPAAATALKILGVSTSKELAEIAASVGLAQNLSALRALVTEGIQPGHMALHARQVAAAAGARGAWVSTIAEQLVAEGQIRAQRAREILAAKGKKAAAAIG